MEKFMQRENGCQGYKSPRGSSEDSDFNDVFGGPPRRFSMQEMRVRYSFGEPEEELAASQLSSLNEKPVFGEESMSRRRHPQGDGFFHDIFRGDDSFGSPRRSDRDRDSVFCSNPSSRVLSPANPLPPKAGPFSTSIPAQFSLPAKLSKASEFTTFASHNRGQHKMDVSANGSTSPRSPSSLSRFPNRNQDDMKSEVHPAYRQSPLSHKASFSSSENSPTRRSDQKESIGNLKRDSKNVDGYGSHFHFSFYKWAGKDAPTLLFLVDNLYRMPKKSSKYNKSASLNERRESKSFDDVESRGLLPTVPESLKVEHDFENEDVKREQQHYIEEEVLNEVSEPKCQISTNDRVNSPGKKEVHTISPDGKNVKRSEGIEAVNLGETARKNGVRGKVREFVQIFNQEADLKPKSDVRRSQSSRWKAVGTDQRENGASPNAEKATGKVNMQYEDTKPDISIKVNENINKDNGERQSSRKTRSFRFSRSFTCERTAFSPDMLRRDSKIFDDALEFDFLVQELSNEHEKITENEHSEDIKAIDAKIRQWSFGKKGNIRSLLSTLQFVLWPDSGWKPVPLADLIESNSVKRAYQKALLRLHPDKLQQKGAAFHQKYTAEKVFDILQEAWDYFNTLTPL